MDASTYPDAMRTRTPRRLQNRTHAVRRILNKAGLNENASEVALSIRTGVNDNEHGKKARLAHCGRLRGRRRLVLLGVERSDEGTDGSVIGWTGVDGELGAFIGWGEGFGAGFRSCRELGFGFHGKKDWSQASQRQPHIMHRAIYLEVYVVLDDLVASQQNHE